MEYFKYYEEKPLEDKFANHMREKLKKRILTFSASLIVKAASIENKLKEK